MVPRQKDEQDVADHTDHFRILPLPLQPMTGLEHTETITVPHRSTPLLRCCEHPQGLLRFRKFGSRFIHKRARTFQPLKQRELFRWASRACRAGACQGCSSWPWPPSASATSQPSHRSTKIPPAPSITDAIMSTATIALPMSNIVCLSTGISLKLRS